jgi:hypothetical protein
MAFVCEKIDEARKQELLALAKPPTVLSFSMRQIIDRERDIVFFCLGGQGERPKEDAAPPNHYCLIWKGLPLHFSAYESGKTIAGQFTVFYEVPGFVCPKHLESQIDNIKSAIREATEHFEQALRETSKPIFAEFTFDSIYFI